MPRLLLCLLACLLAWAPAARAADTPGPCTEAAALGMPDGEDHDHNEASQHQGLYCRIKRAAFLPLTAGELTGGAGPAFTDDSKLGEMDVKGDIAAVAVQEPVGGVLFFDVSNPAKPKFLSRYVHAACALGDNCGAYVEMMTDGKYALLALQQTDLMPGLVSGYAGQGPGVAVISLADPAHPVLTQEYHTVSVQGVHTARSFVIASGPAAGEYAFLIQNGVGTEITRVVDTPAGKQLVHALRPAGRRPDEHRLDARHLHPDRPDRRQDLPLHRGRLQLRLPRLRRLRPGRAGPARRLGPDAAVLERLVRAHDRRHHASAGGGS